MTVAVIGPNAVIQLGEALRAAGLGRLAEDVFTAAGHQDWLAAAPEAMVPEGEVARLHAALWSMAPAAGELARDAGARTGDYILANRIPRPARMLLGILPPGLAELLLLKAITAHAWTFAGSGRFAVEAGTPARFAIHANPLARADGAGRCIWHEAVLTRLWQQLVAPEAFVVETECGHGTGACRFAVQR